MAITTVLKHESLVCTILPENKLVLTGQGIYKQGYPEHINILFCTEAVLNKIFTYIHETDTSSVLLRGGGVTLAFVVYCG